MTNDEMREKLLQIGILAGEVRQAIPPDPPPEQLPWLAWDEKSFDEGLASDNLEIRCDPALVYTKPLTIRRQVKIIIKKLPHADRVKPSDVLPWFQRGITIAADACSLVGLKATDDNLDDIIVCKTGIKHTILSQLLIQGDPVQGNKRGIYANTNGNIDKCYIDGIKRVGQDSQAIFVSGMAEAGLWIDDCFLAAAGMSFMSGGEDMPATLKPRDIIMTNCDLVKTPGMYDKAPGGQNWQRKCSIEFKNIKGFTGRNIHFAGAGIAEGQGGYLIDATVRNQNGGDPTASIENVYIGDCDGTQASGIATFLGQDNVHPSGKLRNFVIENFTAVNLDPKGITGGHARVFFFDKVPENVQLLNIAVTGNNLKAMGYFEGNVPPIGMKLIGLRYPKGMPYEWHNVLGNSLATLKQYAPDIVIQDVAPTA